MSEPTVRCCSCKRQLPVSKFCESRHRAARDRHGRAKHCLACAMSMRSIENTLPMPSDYRFQDITGMTFGRLFVKGYAGKRNGQHSWNCVCACGEQKEVYGGNIKRGLSRSCGCSQRRGNTQHGMSRTPEYGIWKGIINRCYNKNEKAYPNYGGRGIEMCNEWRQSFMAFYEHIGERPSQDYTVDRIDNDGNYEPGNVRWATRKTQSRNTRRNRMIDVNGVMKSLVEWCEHYGVKPSMVCDRLSAGWCVKDALTKPPDPLAGRFKPRTNGQS